MDKNSAGPWKGVEYQQRGTNSVGKIPRTTMMCAVSTWKRIPKWCKISGFVYFCVGLYLESFCYTLLPWTWPSTGILETLYPHFHVHIDMPLENANVLRVLLVADPQIQGRQNEPAGMLGVITRWDADRYLRKTFSRAAKYVNPHLVIFLGDLLDEGTITFGSDYEVYAERFLNIFKWPTAKVIYIPGDNDIGGEGAELVTDENIHRFRSAFRSAASGFWDDRLQFVEINGLTDPVVLSHGNSSNRKRPKICLGHIPTIQRFPDPAAVKALDELKPSLMFSAHNHMASMASRSLMDRGASPRSTPLSSDFSIFELSPMPVNIEEIVVPTCSYRMGVPEMGYGYAVIDLTTSRLFYTVLWLPPRYPHLFLEISASAVFSLVLLVGFTLQKWRLRRRGQQQLRYSA